MPVEFSGPATPLTDSDIEAAAASIGCQVAAVRAVIDVESRGGFLTDGRPKILFERHYFSRITNRKFDGSHPDISHGKWGGYKGGASEYDRLHRAINLDRSAALRSASWGAFQIMGDNFKLAGHNDVEGFVAAMVAGSAGHLKAFVSFVKKTGLADELIRLDWAGFARGYNGPGYKANRYDEKMAAAYLIHSRGGAHVDNPLPVLRMGDKGEDVKRLQAALGLNSDGDFGPNTKKAVIALQKKHGLYADGIVGKQTWGLLDLD